MTWNAGKLKLGCQNVNGMTGIVGFKTDKLNGVVTKNNLMIVSLNITEPPVHKMIKIVGEKLYVSQLKSVKKISNASSNSTIFLLAKMMISYAGKNIIMDPTVKKETWIA